MSGETAKILIVDDDPANLLALEAILGNLGEPLVRANSGEEALRCILADDFAAILLDVRMSGMDGFETARLIRGRSRSRHTPIIFLTAWESPNFQLREAYELGAVDYLVKPLIPEVLRAKVAFFVEFFRQARALRRAERDAAEAAVARRQRFLSDLGDAIQPLSDPAEVMAVTARLLGRYLTASRCAFAQVEADSDRFVIRHDYFDGCRSAAGDYPLSLFAPQAVAVLRTGRTLVVRDADRELEPGDGAEMFNAVGAKAMVCCPLVKSGQLTVIMAIHQTTPRNWTAEEISVVEMVVERCWAYLGRVQAERRLRESEEKYRAIVESTPECVKIVSPDGTLLDMNPAGLRMIGADGPGEAVGRCVYDLIAPEYRDAFRVLNEQVCQGKNGLLEYEIVGLRGTRRSVETHAVPLRDASGSITQLAVTRDVTARRRAEAELRQKQAELTDFVENATVGLHWVGPDGTILWANKAEFALLGYDLDEYIGHNIAEFHADPPVIEDILCRLTNNESLDSYEARLRCKDGSVRHVLISSSVYRADGEFRHTRCFTRDITDRKRAEEALVESEDRFRTLANSIPQLAWMARPDGHIFWYNTRWYEYTGTTAAEMEGWGWQSVHDPSVLPGVLTRWTASIASGEPFDMVFPLRGKDGRFRPFLTLVMPLRDATGQIIRWFGTNTDITVQKAAEEFLREEGHRKDEFIAMFAHELRNPLAPIANAVQLLTRRQDGVTLERARQIIDRQVRQLSHIVDDLLDLSRVSRGKIVLRRERVDLADLARTVAGDAAGGFEAAGLALTIDTPETPVWVEGDRTRLTQVFGNLLGNAQKFTPVGGRVSVNVSAQGAEAVVTVRDTGTGIDPDLLPRLFVPFSQADQGLARSSGGLGLGLALVKGLVELHGGAVKAESSGVGRGALFTVFLARADEPGAVARTVPSVSQVPKVARRLHVLVIEDNRDSADSLKILLELCGCEVTVAYTGPDGLAAAKAIRPDLVLCDIGLPGMSGYEIARELSSTRTDKEPFLAALTGYGRDEDRERAEASGFDCHFVKPMDPAALNRLLAGVG